MKILSQQRLRVRTSRREPLLSKVLLSEATLDNAVGNLSDCRERWTASRRNPTFSRTNSCTIKCVLYIFFALLKSFGLWRRLHTRSLSFLYACVDLTECQINMPPHLTRLILCQIIFKQNSYESALLQLSLVRHTIIVFWFNVSCHWVISQN